MRQNHIVCTCACYILPGYIITCRKKCEHISISGCVLHKSEWCITPETSISNYSISGRVSFHFYVKRYLDIIVTCCLPCDPTVSYN